MATSYTVSIHVNVDDIAALHKHAVAQATTGQGAMSLEEAHEWLGHPDEPDVSSCLRSIFDPGVSPPGASIQDSYCE